MPAHEVLRSRGAGVVDVRRRGGRAVDRLPVGTAPAAQTHSAVHQSGTLETVAPTRPSWSRHVPPALLLAGLLLLTVAMAGPLAQTRVPRNRATVILAIDVSLSMRATDVPPSRLAAAQAGAKTFADNLTPRHQPRTGGVRGDGVDAGLTDHRPRRNRQRPRPSATRRTDRDRRSDLHRPPRDRHPRRRTRRRQHAAARLAKEHNVPISTISFGTTAGAIDLNGSNIPVPVDDESLRRIAELSGGSFFTATSADELQASYQNLQQQIGYETHLADTSRPWLILGSILIAVAAGTALVLNQRLP